jgi:crotonobetainyl-CoA:carnitine CoA-transferase CaiB-like acyl-CoA transferase
MEAWAAVAGDASPPAEVHVAEAGPLLASRVPVAQLATGAVAASLLAAAALHRARTGRPPGTLVLDAAHVACAVRSERYASIDGSPLGAFFHPLSRFFATDDGWIRLHANYPWHRQRLLGVLGTSDDPEAVAAAVRDRRGGDLETAIVEAGGCAAAVRTPTEWLAHPHGSIVSRLPPAEVTPVGPRPAPGRAGRHTPSGLHAPAGPLAASGIRVLDLTRVIAGPVCTRTLAAHGADVLRLDSPSLPEPAGELSDTIVGKRTALVDFDSRLGRHTLEDLLAHADVVVEGYRPGALDRFGLGSETLADRHPGLVVLSLSAWGHSGPWSGRRGFDSLVQAATGIADVERGARPGPGVLPAQLLDHGTGYLAAAAVLWALARRVEDGGTWHGRVSLAQTGAWILRQPRCDPVHAADPDPGPYLDRWTTPRGTVALIRPPGSIGGARLAWSHLSTAYGADQPRWNGA